MADPRQRVSQARALIKFIIDSGTEPDLYRMVLQKELDRINTFTDSSLFHDDLAEQNAPVYFYQFVEHAARHGLKYLSEAQFFEIQTGIFPAHVVEVLNRMSDSPIAKEQYLDFLKCRRFRQTLLCHDHQHLDDSPRPEKAKSFHIASPVRPAETNLKLRSRQLTNFIGPKNSSLQTDNPLIKAAMVALGDAWPKALHFQDLLATARRSIDEGASGEVLSCDDDGRTLGELLLRAYAGGIVEFSMAPPKLVSSLSERPVASPLARLLSRESNEVVNLRHFNIHVDDPLSRRLLQLLDGSRDRNALVDECLALVESGEAVVTADETGIDVDPREVRQFLTTEIEKRLTELAAMALLIG
jgi:methyltransferase-like protein